MATLRSIMIRADNDRLIQDIVENIRRRDSGETHANRNAPGANFDFDFEMLIQNEDETGKSIMRRIVHELTAG